MTSSLHQTCHILLVEDSPQDIDLTKRAFSESGGHAVSFDIARDGEEALAYIHRWNNGAPLPVFILLDLKLPKVDGFEVLKAFKAHPRFRFIPIIVLTSAAKAGTEIKDAYKFGANSYIIKEQDFERFREIAGDLKQYWHQLNIQPVKMDF